jgi:hypothetical protein
VQLLVDPMIPPELRQRRRAAAASVALAVVLVALVALLVWWRGGGDRATAASTRPAPRTAAVATPARPIEARPRLRLLGRELLAPRPPAQEPIIDTVTVEKSRVCVGEENLVTVTAHTPGGTDDAFVQAHVGGIIGGQVPVRGRRPETETDEPTMVSVSGRDHTISVAEVPQFTVEECVVPRQVLVKHRLLANTTDEIELFARVRNVGATDTLEVQRWEWDFGDGTHATTTSPIAEHDYAGRAQDALTSSFLVTATAIGPDGAKLVGRASVTLVNRAFELLAYKQMIMIETRLTPRFVEVDAAGVARQGVAVWHRYEAPVQVTRLVRTRWLDGGSTSLPPEELDPIAVLGTDRLLPGQAIQLARTLDPRETPNAAFDFYLVEGRSDDGISATGGFTVMAPPPLPTPEDNEPVTDPMVAARIMKAMAILKKQNVTDEDLYRLEREGAFADLQPVALAGAPSAAAEPSR